MSGFHTNDKSRMRQDAQNKIFVNPNYARPNFEIPKTTIHINPRFTNAHINPLFTNAHINPLFRNAHINPNFKTEVRTTSPNTVHINLKLFNPLFVNNKFHTSKKQEPCIKSDKTNILTSNVSSKYSFVSNRKLIKEPAEKTVSAKTDTVKPYFKKTKNKLISLSLQTSNKTTQFLNNIKQISTSTILNKHKYSLKRYAKTPIKKSRMISTQYKVDRRTIHPELNKLRVRTKYTVRPFNYSTRANTNLSNTSKKLNKSVIRVLGIKYLVQKHGNTLKRIRINEAGTKPPNRISIGSTTYAYKNDKKICRISKPIKNRKLNNVPCLVFRKFGFCKRHELGRCFKVHDKRQVDICKDFLAGKCISDKCVLSHEVSAAKMPICLHYLAGACGRDNCPYPHIKHSLEVPVCKQFLRGYCEKAEKCDQRHVFICPDLDKNRSCPRIKCPYPHGITKSKPKLKTIKKGKNKQKHKEEVMDIVQDKSRYYLKVENAVENNTNEETVGEIERSRAIENEVSIDENDTKINTKRPALGILPSYIPI